MTNTMPTGMFDEITRAAQQGDRWLMIAIMVFAGMAFVWVAKYFVSQQRELLADHKSARTEFHASMVKMTADYSQLAQRSVDAIGASEEVIRQNISVMERVLAEMRLCRRGNPNPQEERP
jgi:hypothetical protein